jgi:hypothetical protein
VIFRKEIWPTISGQCDKIKDRRQKARLLKPGFSFGQKWGWEASKSFIQEESHFIFMIWTAISFAGREAFPLTHLESIEKWQFIELQADARLPVP